MGIYVNPGNEEFKRAANSKIYVDKTMLLAFTNQNLKSDRAVCTCTDQGTKIQ